MSFRKLLVANRGEIAVRIFRACRELGIGTVAVFSEADEGAMHRRAADESYRIGPASPQESYLNVGRIVAAIERSGADAVHPGYGFLSESAAFARAVEETGAAWVGPPPEAMEAMGLKVRAKEISRRAEVPTVPGYDGEGDEERLAEEAAKIGYPILIKASAGGGGRGMRAVRRPEDFAEAVRGAAREARAAFGDGSVFLEKLIERPRHVEVQVIGDRHGSVIHLYERECSIQRRHQKVVEEAPSPALDPALREEICSSAVRLAREAGYHNAGTVEFLLSSEEFYFLEMNARLQVEHPVTELVTGLDLVHLQLAVAAGERLPLSQEDVTLRGSAIEARVYAEGEGGLPTGGRLRVFAPPEGPGIRNDAGVEAGDEVPVHYDPMISKLVVSAPTRDAAVRRMERALAEYEVVGVPTNLPLLRRIVAHPAFAAGDTTTAFLEENRLTEPPQQEPPPDTAFLLAASAELWRATRGTVGRDPFESGPWRLLGASRLRYAAGDGLREVRAGRSRAGGFKLELDGRDHTVEVLSLHDGRLQAVLDGEPVTAAVGFGAAGDVEVALGPETYRLVRPAAPDLDEASRGDASSAAGLTAPMPGTVVKVLVREGEEVEEGRLLLVLEAMKMEQPITAPHAGTVRALRFAEGDLAPGGAVLVELDEA